MLCFLPADGLYISDVSSMAEGVEMRVPYLNNKVVDFALKVPVSVKCHKGVLKSLLRAIEAEYIPQQMLFKGKRGFNPFKKASWMTKYFKDMAGEYLSSDHLKAQGLFDDKAYQEMTDSVKAGQVNIYNKVWNMFIFQVWAQSHL
ncbi:MAG: hypothetical protein A2Z88_06330 [Omnitrophica WOR_2 bacterium GWA2_47_8]|nr:MAG: hypothetical protein A2Z88_06330 [Omnitrophica WOR_2 bacterium GWA2_47_8]